MSRPNNTSEVARVIIDAEVVDGLAFASACVLDQRVASHKRKDHSWDKRYAKALDAVAGIIAAHKRLVKQATKKAARVANLGKRAT